MNGKKGLSQVVGTVLLILLTISLVAGAWAVINGFVGSKLDKTSACKDIVENVYLNPDYTCYDSSSGSLLISISREDFEMDSLLVSVSEETSSRSFTLEEVPQPIADLFNYNSAETEVSLPNKEAGRTYCFSGFSEKPSSVYIAPKVSGFQCEVSDSINDIPLCIGTPCS